MDGDQLLQIFAAAEAGMTHFVLSRCEQDPRLLSRADAKGMQLLHVAALCGHMDLVCGLLKRGANAHGRASFPENIGSEEDSQSSEVASGSAAQSRDDDEDEDEDENEQDKNENDCDNPELSAPAAIQPPVLRRRANGGSGKDANKTLLPFSSSRDSIMSLPVKKLIKMAVERGDVNTLLARFCESSESKEVIEWRDPKDGLSSWMVASKLGEKSVIATLFAIHAGAGHIRSNFPRVELPDGEYVGHLLLGDPSDKGELVLASGPHATTTMRQGFGNMRYSNGNIYQGEWLRGKRHGPGVVVYASGNFYSGDWQLDKKWGKGCMFFRGGHVYEGEFASDMRSGVGTMRYQNGNVYQGGWLDDLRQGDGTISFTGGDVVRGKWENDHIELGKFNYANGDEYEGEIDPSTFSRHGQGCMLYADKGVYVGAWKQGKRWGKGQYTDPHGSVSDGNWKNGKRHGIGKLVCTATDADSDSSRKGAIGGVHSESTSSANGDVVRKCLVS